MHTPSRISLPYCTNTMPTWFSPFFSFLRSRLGSLSARITRAAAEGTTDTVAFLFWIVNLTVTFRPMKSLVPLAMSSPTFFGDCGTHQKIQQKIWCQARANLSVHVCMWHAAYARGRGPVDLKTHTRPSAVATIKKRHDSKFFFLARSFSAPGTVKEKRTRPSGPILGARELVAPTSPPMARRHTAMQQTERCQKGR